MLNVVNSYLSAGVDAHLVRVMPIGIDTNLYNPETTHARRLFPKQLDDGTPTFTFLSVFRWEDKKNWRGLLSAFYEEFHDSPHVKLYIKTSTYKRSSPLYDALTHLHIFGDDDAREIFESRVIIMTEKLRVDEMPGLYKGADAFILPSHSEGWGLPYMEAMAMGLPTIGTQFGGMLQYMNSGNSFLIPASSAASSMMKKKKRWAYPRVDHIRQVMRYVMEHPEEAQIKATQGMLHVRTKYNAHVVADMVYTRLREIALTIKTTHNHPDIHDPVDREHWLKYHVHEGVDEEQAQQTHPHDHHRQYEPQHDEL